MDSIQKIFKIGNGPSSSHTMGPRRAAELFRSKNPDCHAFHVTLYGSLAATGKGHLTDLAITEALQPFTTTFSWEPDTFLDKHPNGLTFYALDEQNHRTKSWTVFSIGGGEIIDEYQERRAGKNIYPHARMKDILNHCHQNGKQFWEYVEDYEDDLLWPYLEEVWNVMKDAVNNGLNNEGVLPGMLKLPRKASAYMIKANGFKGSLKRRSQVFAYALAVAEENAGGGKIVTAPTCGSCGVLPAVLFLLSKSYKFSNQKIFRALATAGLIGNLVKENASISGAEVGCQGEIGTACAMASAAAAQLFGGTISQVEYAAEMGLEHHLGLTCDPIAGLVQIPCIERNAFAASRALDANNFAIMSDGRHRVSLDKVIFTMNETGKDLPSLYRETSNGGLAVENGM